MFRITTLAALTALPVAVLSVCTFAQNAPGAGTQPSMFEHMLQKMDTNGDGRISLDEYLAAAKTKFQALDAVNKGSIDAATIAASPAAERRLEHRAEFMVKHLDTAGNGYVTEDDVVAAAKRRFARLDKDGDGKLTPDELTASRFGAGNSHREDFAQKRFARLDANHDGVVTQDEFVAAATARFHALDTQGTGQVTAAEIAASPKAQARVNHIAEHLVKRMDTNGDGVVSQDEFLAAAQKRFQRLDKNGDGFIDADEVPAHRWARGGQPAPNAG